MAGALNMSLMSVPLKSLISRIAEPIRRPDGKVVLYAEVVFKR